MPGNRLGAKLELEQVCIFLLNHALMVLGLLARRAGWNLYCVACLLCSMFVVSCSCMCVMLVVVSIHSLHSSFLGFAHSISPLVVKWLIEYMYCFSLF